MSAIGLAVTVANATAAAGVAFSGNLGSTRELYAQYSKSDGTAVAGVTTLTLDTRASSAEPWVPILTLTNAPQAVPVPVSELRVSGVCDAADGNVHCQVFARV